MSRLKDSIKGKREVVLWGSAPKRRDRVHHRKPLAVWKERMARMAHSAQRRRWLMKPVTQEIYNEVFKAISSGRVTEFVWYAFIRSSL